MKLHVYHVDDETVVEVKGNMVGGSDSDKFRECVRDLADEGRRHLVVDLSSVKMITSPGVGMILGAFASARNRDGDLRVAGLTSQSRLLFHTIHLRRMMDVFETVGEALQSYRTGQDDRDDDEDQSRASAAGD